MYATMIRIALAKAGQVGAADPRHIEAYMRLEHATLDGLTPEKFRSEVLISLGCVRHGGIEEAELLAKSFGL